MPPRKIIPIQFGHFRILKRLGEKPRRSTQVPCRHLVASKLAPFLDTRQVENKITPTSTVRIS